MSDMRCPRKHRSRTGCPRLCSISDSMSETCCPKAHISDRVSEIRSDLGHTARDALPENTQSRTGCPKSSLVSDSMSEMVCPRAHDLGQGVRNLGRSQKACQRRVVRGTRSRTACQKSGSMSGTVSEMHCPRPQISDKMSEIRIELGQHSVSETCCDVRHKMSNSTSEVRLGGSDLHCPRLADAGQGFRTPCPRSVVSNRVEQCISDRMSEMELGFGQHTRAVFWILLVISSYFFLFLVISGSCHFLVIFCMFLVIYCYFCLFWIISCYF